MPLTTVAADVEEHDLAKIAARAKCATVTMMLAERIVRNDWSVDGEQLVGTNAMNVWQTLEFISGANLRKRYHYEGYNDTDNAVRTLTPSWRRDSFLEKKDDVLTPRPEARKGNNVPNTRPDETLGATVAIDVPNSLLTEPKTASTSEKSKKRKGKRGKRTANKKTEGIIEIDPVYNMSPLQYTDIVKCK